ncbi:MAG: DUF2332 domain-containing protein [Actinomycetia bacterium]|nr:DUF2332 domain-containing protein [Actinomycetes bacterium]
MAELEKLERDFRLFSQFNGKASPLYGRLALSIADDPELMTLLHAAPEQQQIPVLLFAAMHDLLLRGDGAELAAFYPNLSSSVPDGDPFPVFRRVALANLSALQATIASRNTQTNEVGRCAYFLPVFGIVADEVGPLAQLDVGASAGLNLYWPSYAYRYKDGRSVGAGSTVELSCSTRGEPPIPQTMPKLSHAIGLDMSPIDVRDDEAVRWLEACVWPDQEGRFQRLVSAIEIARKSPPDLRQGDAVANVGALVEEVSAFGHPLVTTSWILSYLTEEQQRAFVAALDDAATRHDLSWVVAEAPAQTPGLPIPGDEQITVISLVTWRSGERSVRRLATAHPHGSWLNWESPTP